MMMVTSGETIGDVVFLPGKFLNRGGADECRWSFRRIQVVSSILFPFSRSPARLVGERNGCLAIVK